MPRRRRRRRRRPPSKSEASPEGGDHADNIPILASPRLFVIITAVYFTPVVAAVLHALPSLYSTVLYSTVQYNTVQYCLCRAVRAILHALAPFCIIEKQPKIKNY